MSFCDYFLPLIKMFSKFIHVTCISTSPLFYGYIIFHCMCIPHLSTHLIDEHLGYFHLLAIMNNTGVNICVCFPVVYVFISLGYICKSGISESNDYFMFHFLRNFQTIFQSGCTILYPTSNVWGYCLLHIFLNSCYYLTSHFPMWNLSSSAFAYFLSTYSIPTSTFLSMSAVFEMLVLLLPP